MERMMSSAPARLTCELISRSRNVQSTISNSTAPASRARARAGIELTVAHVNHVADAKRHALARRAVLHHNRRHRQAAHVDRARVGVERAKIDQRNMP